MEESSRVRSERLTECTREWYPTCVFLSSNCASLTYIYHWHILTYNSRGRCSFSMPTRRRQHEYLLLFNLIVPGLPVPFFESLVARAILTWLTIQDTPFILLKFECTTVILYILAWKSPWIPSKITQNWDMSTYWWSFSLLMYKSSCTLKNLKFCPCFIILMYALQVVHLVIQYLQISYNDSSFFISRVDPTVQGDYTICFDNSFSRLTSKTVFFEIIVDSAGEDEDDDEEWKNAVAADELYGDKLQSLEVASVNARFAWIICMLRDSSFRSNSWHCV